MTDRIEQIIAKALLQPCDNHRERAELARETARQVVEAAQAGVTLKPLEWTPFRAETPWGAYNIDDQTDRSAGELNGRLPFLLSGSVIKMQRFNSLEAARAAAQEDHEGRVMSALVPSPSCEDGIKEGLRRAAALVREKHIVHGAGMDLLEPRWDGNRSGLAYADAIEALSLLPKEGGK